MSDVSTISWNINQSKMDGVGSISDHDFDLFYNENSKLNFEDLFFDSKMPPNTDNADDICCLSDSTIFEQPCFQVGGATEQRNLMTQTELDDNIPGEKTFVKTPYKEVTAFASSCCNRIDDRWITATAVMKSSTETTTASSVSLCSQVTGNKTESWSHTSKGIPGDTENSQNITNEENSKSYHNRWTKMKGCRGSIRRTKSQNNRTNDSKVLQSITDRYPGVNQSPSRAKIDALDNAPMQIQQGPSLCDLLTSPIAAIRDKRPTYTPLLFQQKMTTSIKLYGRESSPIRDNNTWNKTQKFHRKRKSPQKQQQTRHATSNGQNETRFRFGTYSGILTEKLAKTHTLMSGNEENVTDDTMNPTTLREFTNLSEQLTKNYEYIQEQTRELKLATQYLICSVLNNPENEKTKDVLLHMKRQQEQNARCETKEQ